MKTLILFSTRDGQTREIASYLASELKEMGIWADVVNLHRAEEPDWDCYDRVVIGASIRYGHYHSAFQEFVKKYATRLNGMPSAFIPLTWWRVKLKNGRRRLTAMRVSF